MTDNVNNKQEILEKYREAGRILKIVRAEAMELIRAGNSLLSARNEITCATSVSYTHLTLPTKRIV